VSIETHFDLKLPKLEAKLASALSKTKRLFRLFRFYTETESFDVSIESKQTEDQPVQFDREHSLLFFTENLGFFRYFSFFSFFSVFSVCYETVCFDWFASIPKQRVWMFRLNQNKLDSHPNSLKESIFGYFSENFGLFRYVSVCFGCFDMGSKHRNKPKFFVFGFTKKTEANAKQILFRFVSVQTKNYFCFFRGHPRLDIP
jgi:hypothetical protein